jgi:hypothetical protein
MNLHSLLHLQPLGSIVVLPPEIDRLLKEPFGELINDKIITKKKYSGMPKMLVC